MFMPFTSFCFGLLPAGAVFALLGFLGMVSPLLGVAVALVVLRQEGQASVQGGDDICFQSHMQPKPYAKQDILLERPGSAVLGFAPCLGGPGVLCPAKDCFFVANAPVRRALKEFRRSKE